MPAERKQKATVEAKMAKDILLDAREICKTYSGVSVVTSANFVLAAGEVHGLVGANGAGKSTLTKILSGATRPDSGHIFFEGKEVSLSNPRDGLHLGIAVIHQEPAMVPGMTALSNVFLGNPISRGTLLKRAEMEKRFNDLTGELGLAIPPNILVDKLPVSARQMVDILRAVQARRKVFMMDEPTASLDPESRRALYGLIDKLSRSGSSVVFISHDLHEVLLICSRVSVMRDGRMIDTRLSADWTKEGLVSAMMGEGRREFALQGDRAIGDVIFRAKNVSVPGRVEDISFDLHEGEILGIAGLVGSGRTELLRALAGAESEASGRYQIDGNWYELPKSIREAMANNIVMVPEDRKSQGLVFGRSVFDNIALPNLTGFSKFGILNRIKMKKRFREIVERVKLSASRMSSKVETLSGGNQQKVVVAKYLLRQPKVMLLDEPSRGVDISARNEMFQSIIAAAERGMGIVLVSSDINEVLEYSDRVLVVQSGRSVGLLSRGEADLGRILKLKFSVDVRQK